MGNDDLFMIFKEVVIFALCIQNTHTAMILLQLRLRFLYYQFTVDFGILCIDIKFYRI